VTQPSRYAGGAGTQDLFVENRCLVYFSVLHDPFGQFKGAVIVGKDGIEKQLPLLKKLRSMEKAVDRPSS
jgi:hypothetical protein